MWTLLSVILLLSLLTPQGVLLCSGGNPDAGSSNDAEIAGIVNTTDPGVVALLENSSLPLDEMIHMVETDTYHYIDGQPRLFPVGVNATVQNRIGDCTDLALLRAEVLRKNGIAARPVHGIMVWDTERLKSQALHLEFGETAVGIHDWVETDGGRTLGAYESWDGVMCLKIGEGVCLQPIFETLGFL
jgi:transglutaminase-like putative cysteine protease